MSDHAKQSTSIRAALTWLPADGSERRGAPLDVSYALRRARARGLVSRRYAAVNKGYAWWSLTDQGRSFLAAAVAAEENAHGAR